MMLTSAFEVTRQTLLILVPESLLLLAATMMMTAGPFVRLPRRAWWAASALALVAALVALFALHDRTTDLYTAVALNDAFSFWARVVFVLSGLVLLALAHDQA